ncbi:MAG: hypothetical protein WBB68_00800, partial [Candidatus Moraniibacteriota bacterium]
PYHISAWPRRLSGRRSAASDANAVDVQPPTDTLQADAHIAGPHVSRDVPAALDHLPFVRRFGPPVRWVRRRSTGDKNLVVEVYSVVILGTVGDALGAVHGPEFNAPPGARWRQPIEARLIHIVITVTTGNDIGPRRITECHRR